MTTYNSSSTLNRQSFIPVNPDLVWDYAIPNETEQSDAFRRWYVARVLTRGRAEDLKNIGLAKIFEYFPTLNLPAEIRHFWHWYFNLPEIRKRYGDPHCAATEDFEDNRTNSAKSYFEYIS